MQRATTVLIDGAGRDLHQYYNEYRAEGGPIKSFESQTNTLILKEKIESEDFVVDFICSGRIRKDRQTQQLTPAAFEDRSV